MGKPSGLDAERSLQDGNPLRDLYSVRLTHRQPGHGWDGRAGTESILTVPTEPDRRLPALTRPLPRLAFSCGPCPSS